MSDLLTRVAAALAGHYGVERELGSGGMATVYLARDLKHGRQVAIKVLRPELAAALGSERFLREVRIVAQLSHPHILPLHDSGEAGGFLYYVMPYVEGESLRARLDREGPLPVAEAARLLREITDGLAYAHVHGIVHRDIKPDNVMLSGRHALVTDFGVAKAVSEAAAGRDKETTAGVALGTPAYMSPEQATAEPGLDHRVDIYAIGALGYELLTGRPPFVGETAQEILSAHVVMQPEPVTVHRPGVPPGFESLIMQCLAKKPADRWQSADELERQLEVLATPSGGVTPTTARPVAIRMPPARRRRVILMVALGGLVLAAGGWLVRSRLGRSLVPNRVFVAGFINETGDPELDQVGKIVADWVARRLQETRSVEVLDPRTALASPAEPSDPGGMARVQNLAKSARAGTLVSGTYYLRGDALEFQARVTETSTGRLLQPLAPVSGPVQDPMQGVEALSQAVMASIATVFSEDLGSLARAVSHPANYAAYREYVAGVERFEQGDAFAAMRHFYGALRTDPTFVAAALWVASVHVQQGQYRIADSITGVLEQARTRLTDVERHVLDWLRADLMNDHAASYRAGRQAYELAPASVEIGWLTALSAYKAHRLGEMVRILEGVDPTRGFLRGFPAYWGYLTICHHLQGRHNRELVDARRGRQQYPNGLAAAAYEARALAALGRTAELEALAAEAVRFPPERGWVPGDIPWIAGIELRAHGYRAEARTMLERAVEIFRAAPPDPTSPFLHRFNFGLALYEVERWKEAEAVFAALVEADPADYTYLSYLGLVSAELGDRARAAELSRRLGAWDDKYSIGFRVLLQGRIAAAMGERAEALRLVKDAYARGSWARAALHQWMEFELLNGDPEFEELLKPLR